ncbi:uncharacterized protein LOC129757072 [Uranotaenia lowii]|uniref:uncharacterized protein LOC129757072 n=1 Tax=Uranotaenia lowii TaxID=190385 RepID=UPI00247A79EC|nr:uncharacterized protein LOC129757072 [Uranotaenia lowii]
MDFDWDNISIGEPELNESNNFFFRHVKKEKSTPNGCNSMSNILSENSQRSTTRILRNAFTPIKNRQEDPCEKAYRYAQVYEAKRQALKEKEGKQLQEMKKFQARPAPNFNKGLKKENSEPKFTLPITPKQMKPDRLQKAADMAKKQQERVKGAHKASEQHQDQDGCLLTGVAPHDSFTLRMSARLQERKLMDEHRQKIREEKERWEAEQKRLAAEEELKKIRKQKEFKAKPNPFRK